MINDPLLLGSLRLALTGQKRVGQTVIFTRTHIIFAVVVCDIYSSYKHSMVMLTKATYDDDGDVGC